MDRRVAVDGTRTGSPTMTMSTMPWGCRASVRVMISNEGSKDSSGMSVRKSRKTTLPTRPCAHPGPRSPRSSVLVILETPRVLPLENIAARAWSRSAGFESFDELEETKA